MPNRTNPQFLVCDENPHARRLVADVLAGAGFMKVQHAVDGQELLRLTEELHPQVVLTSSRIPGISGLDYTRKIRAGYHNVSRVTSIIVMTNTPTQKFLDAARDAGVDEMLVRPFTGAAVLARVEAVLLRPRRFVESVAYVGPCRRRRMLDDYSGPLRRLSDPVTESLANVTAMRGGAPWEAEANRALMRQCVAHVAHLAQTLDVADRRKLRELDAAAHRTKQLADDVCDQATGDAARSLSRYIGAMGATGMLDMEVVRTHIDAMQKLGMLGSPHQAEREELVQGLVAIVDKRLGRKPAAA